MYLLTVIFLFLGFLVSAQTPAPTAVEIQAIQDGEAAGQQLGNQISNSQQQGLNTQNTNYSSLYQSSVDSMMNAQMGEASATLMASSLATASQPYANNCSQQSTTGLEACATGSVLAGMSQLMGQSSESFATPISQAWYNVCQFSSLGCGTQTIPNPFTPIVGSQPQVSPKQYQQIVQTFLTQGYAIDPKTGVVNTPDGSKIDPNSKRSLEKGLGNEEYKALQGLLDRIKSEIDEQLAKVKTQDYKNILGLDFKNGNTNGNTNGKKTNTSKSNEETQFLRNGKITEKEREKVEIPSLVKNYKGTPIGVAGADLFKMIKKRYEIKASQKIFLQVEP